MTNEDIIRMAREAGLVMYDYSDPSLERFANLVAALAQPETEPVAWGILNTRPTEKQPLMMVMLDEPEPSHLVVPLYTAPPQPELVGQDKNHIGIAAAIRVRGQHD
jgi:hypothetical protein